MSPGADNRDDTLELQVLMGAYFDALLQPQTLSVVEAGQVCANAGKPALISSALIDTASPSANTVPAYRRIKVGGLTLGVPAEMILEIVAAPAPWSPVTAQPTWVLGSYVGAQGTAYKVVATAAVLAADGTRLGAAHYSHIVVLKNQAWALACDEVGELLSPDPQCVHWRGAQGKRPWLAGTLSAPLCALLDMPSLIKLLALQ